jgi:hypothetical protein
MRALFSFRCSFNSPSDPHRTVKDIFISFPLAALTQQPLTLVLAIKVELHLDRLFPITFYKIAQGRQPYLWEVSSGPDGSAGGDPRRSELPSGRAPPFKGREKGKGLKCWQYVHGQLGFPMSGIPVPLHIPTVLWHVIWSPLVKYLRIQKHSTHLFIYLVGFTIIVFGKKLWAVPNRKS